MSLNPGKEMTQVQKSSMLLPPAYLSEKVEDPQSCGQVHLLPLVEPVATFRLTRVEESHEGVIRARHSRSPLLPPLR